MPHSYHTVNGRRPGQADQNNLKSEFSKFIPEDDAVSNAGCGRIFTDTVSGSKSERVGLREVIDFIREGDTLVVWRLDRLGRSLKQLIENVNALQNRGIGFRSLQESIDTTTSGGKLIFHIFASLAEFERDVIRERTQAGLRAARARGRQGGRPPALDNRTLELVRAMYADLNKSPRDICNAFNISRTTLYRYVSKIKRPQVAIEV